jgi:hypothetical protein
MLASHYALAQGLVQEITQPDGSLHHQFGFSVAVDGNTMVTGDPDYIWQGHPCMDERGAIAVYNETGGVWQRTQQFLYLGDGTARTRLGWSVAIRGNVIVAATPGQNYVSGATTIADAGALSVYRRPSATAPFAFSGQAFAPNPTANAEFTSTWPVATNGTYAAATAGSANPNVVHVYSVSGSTPTYLTTITMPVPIVTSLFITDQNVLVASYANIPGPIAYALNGTQAVALNTSLLGGTSYALVSPLAGSGNTISFVRNNNVSATQELAIATLTTNSVQSVLTVPISPAHQFSDPALIAMKENQGIFIYSPSAGPISSYEYTGGAYTFSTITPATPANLSANSMAFNGVDLFIGNPFFDHNDLTQQCGRVGSIYVYRPLASLTAALQSVPVRYLLLN